MNKFRASADATAIEEYLEQLHNETPEGLRLTARTYVHKMVTHHFKDRKWNRATRVTAVNDWLERNIPNPRAFLVGEAMKELWNDENRRKALIERLRESAKKRWSDPIKRANQIKAMHHRTSS